MFLKEAQLLKRRDANKSLCLVYYRETLVLMLSLVNIGNIALQPTELEIFFKNHVNLPLRKIN